MAECSLDMSQGVPLPASAHNRSPFWLGCGVQKQSYLALTIQTRASTHLLWFRGCQCDHARVSQRFQDRAPCPSSVKLLFTSRRSECQAGECAKWWERLQPPPRTPAHCSHLSSPKGKKAGGGGKGGKGGGVSAWAAANFRTMPTPRLRSPARALCAPGKAKKETGLALTATKVCTVVLAVLRA